MTRLSAAAFITKYNDAASGLFKSGQVQGIGSDDMRTFIQDLCDSFPTWLGSKIYVNCGDFNFSGDAFPTSGGSGATGEVLAGNAFRCSVEGEPGGVLVPVNALVIALIDTPGQTATNWQIIII